ncbi:MULTISPECIES: metal-dependent hydrolase [Bacillus]|uniref:metal-dependent hydrolase n=1 Tax=Bacillus TaxID=1386 RepID=UPI0004749459|nr:MULTISPECIES: metal-dependent hydrolase [Bacillus]AYC54101.1 metal-dependent hydrolase [Bacillus licheniformis]NWN80884.1 metal-dependent hydrolase [Bacillus sp. (in: firmicutes)]
MTGKTHMAGGLVAGITLSYMTNLDPATLTAAGVVGGLLPDICHSGSKIGRKFPVLSRTVNLMFGHRTFTHSLLFLLIMAVVLIKFVSNEAITVGILAGMVSHFILDAATKNGIKLFYPFKMTVRFPVTTTTGGMVEYIVLTFLVLFIVCFGQSVIAPYL